MRKIILTLVLLSLSACSSPLTAEKLSSIKQVGIVTLASDTFYGTHVGLTIFNNEYFRQPTPEWKIASIAENSAVSTLKECSTYNVRVLDYDRSALLSKYIKPKGRDVLNIADIDDGALHNNSLLYDLDAIKPTLLELARAQNVDTLIIIQEKTKPQNSAYDIHLIGMYGMIKLGRIMGLPGSMTLYSNPLFTIVNVKNGEVLSSFYEFRDLTTRPAKYLEESELKWKSSFSDYTGEERASLQDTITKITQSAVSGRIRSSGICNKK